MSETSRAVIMIVLASIVAIIICVVALLGNHKIEERLHWLWLILVIIEIPLAWSGLTEVNAHSSQPHDAFWIGVWVSVTIVVVGYVLTINLQHRRHDQRSSRLP